ELTKEQQVAAERGKRVKELEARLGLRAGDLERAKTELERQGQEQARVEADLRRQLETATTAAKQGQEAHKQAQSRCGQLEEELAGLRQAREQLNTQFTKEQQTTAESGKRVKELEAQVGQRAAELERAKSELEKQGQERAQV